MVLLLAGALPSEPQHRYIDTELVVPGILLSSIINGLHVYTELLGSLGAYSLMRLPDEQSSFVCYALRTPSLRQELPVHEHTHIDVKVLH